MIVAHSDSQQYDKPDDLPPVELQDFLENISQPASSATEPPSDWIEVNGKPQHKASLIRVAFQSKYGCKPTDRVKHVITGFTREPKIPNLNSLEVTGVDSFWLGNLYAALINCEGELGVGVFQTFALNQAKSRVSRVNKAELSLRSANISVIGEMLNLVPLSSETTLMETKWIWTGEYIDFQPRSKHRKKKSKPVSKTTTTHVHTTRNSLLVRVPGYLAHPIHADVADTSSLDVTHAHHINGTDLTWCIQPSTLPPLVDGLWEEAKSKKWLTDVPALGASKNKMFLYKLADGMLRSFVNDVDGTNLSQGSRTLIATNTSAVAADAKINSRIACLTCGVLIKEKNHRSHVGAHILRAVCGVVEKNLVNQVRIMKSK